MSTPRLKKILRVALVGLVGVLVAAWVAVLLFKEGGRSAAWQQGYAAGVSDGKRIHQQMPTETLDDRNGIALGCDMTSQELGAESEPDGTSYPPLPSDIETNAAKTKDYRDGWAKGCEDSVNRH